MDCPVGAPVHGRADRAMRLRVPAAPPAPGQVGADHRDVGPVELDVDEGLDHRLQSTVPEKIHPPGTRQLPPEIPSTEWTPVSRAGSPCDDRRDA